MRVALLLLIVPFAGCLDAYNEYQEFDIDEPYENPAVFPGSYQMNGGTSLVLEGGRIPPIPLPEVVRLRSNLPAYTGPLADQDDAQVDIVMAVWRPNTTEPVPVIVDAGPYYEVGQHCRFGNQDPCQAYDDDTIDWPGQKTDFLRANFIPHGYAVVQMAVRGTGTAGGCMDLLGPSEAHDLNQGINWLGSQPWSNGNVAMIGASYDGSTPWIVAASGNPHLRAIVPTAGLPDIFDLMFHNGTSETRGAIMHNTVYYGYGFDDEFPQQPDEWPEGVPWLPPAGVGQANGRSEAADMHNLLCPEVIEGSALGAWSTALGERGAGASSYWTERDYRQRVADNYNGGVFIIHGLQDWNVDPHAAVPFNRQLHDAGIDVMEWYGQWGHTFPDGSCIGAAPEWVVLPCRIDFAETLYRFFEKHLKGSDIEQVPPTQVQDNLGFWRIADTYPPTDADWQELRLSADNRLVDSGAQAGSFDLTPHGVSGPGQFVAFRSEVFEEDTLISGLPQLKLPFEMVGQGGQIGVWMFDEDPRGLVRARGVFFNALDRSWTPGGIPVVGHAQMNLRYYAGGEDPQTLMPGTTYVAQVEMDPLEVQIPAGNRLVIWVFQYQYPDHDATVTRAPVTIHVGEAAKLRLPIVDVDPRDRFPVPGAHFLEETYVPQMYVPYPAVGGVATTAARLPIEVA